MPSVDPERRASPLAAHVFVSYATENRDIAEWLRARLYAESVAASVWLDRHEIAGGDKLKQEINHGLLRTNIVLALITRESTDLARNREWILYEHREADRLLRRIIPLWFDGTIPEYFHDLRRVDFRSDRASAFLELRTAIARYAAASGRELINQAPSLERRFVGREGDLKAIRVRMDAERDRLSTGRPTLAIQGMGGLGKTMVAHELVRRLACHFPGGVVLEKRGQSPSPASSTLQRWAGLALGKTAEREYNDNEVRGLLQNFGELLVLIDDVYEHDLEAVALLLSSLPPDATRIITTRSANVVSELGCTCYALVGLSSQDTLDLIADRLRARFQDALGSAAFETQFASVRGAIVELVDRVDGHALALELAAGRFTHVPEIPARVAQFISDLKRGVKTLRSATLRVSSTMSVAVSLDLSLADVARMDAANGTSWRERFVDLGVFPDGARMDVDLILAVWAPEGTNIADAREALEGLERRSLVNRDIQSGRYSLHPLLRAFAAELLQQDADRLGRHQRHYARYVIDRVREGFARPIHEWQLWLGPYVPHIWSVGESLLAAAEPLIGDVKAWAAIESSLPDPAPSEPVARTIVELSCDFAAALAEYIIRRPTLGARGHRILEVGLASARLLRRPEAEMRALRALGGWYAQRDPPAAVAFFEAALTRARALGDEREEGRILSFLGEVQRTCSRFDEASSLLQQALAIHSRGSRREDRHMEARTLKYLGETHWRQARYDAAMRCYGESLRLVHQLQDDAMWGDLLNKIGSVQFALGHLEIAIAFFELALQIHREIGDQTNEAVDLNDAGIAKLYLDKHDEAIPLLTAALALHRDVANPKMEAITLLNIAAAHLGNGELSVAGELTAAALAIAIRTGNRVTEGWGQSHEGRIFQARGAYDVALKRFDGAIALFAEIKDPRSLAGVLGYRAILLAEHLDRREEAARDAAEGLRILEASGSQRAFGGRHVDGFRELIDRFRSPGSSPVPASSPSCS